MDSKVKAVVVECSRGSDEERLTFPQVVQALAGAGVERYHADLLRHEKIFYLPTGESEAVACAPIQALPAEAFSSRAVDAAVRAVQRGEIGYRAFCEAIARAGCAGYLVTLAGRRAVYYGRTGETHVEHFPS